MLSHKKNRGGSRPWEKVSFGSCVTAASAFENTAALENKKEKNRKVDLHAEKLVLVFEIQTNRQKLRDPVCLQTLRYKHVEVVS